MGIVILVILGLAVQVGVIAMGVNTGTQGVRRDLNDLKALLGTPPGN